MSKIEILHSATPHSVFTSVGRKRGRKGDDGHERYLITSKRQNAVRLAVARTRSGSHDPCVAGGDAALWPLREDVREINSEVKKGRANSPRVTRLSTRSAETERDGVTYAIDFMWLPGPDSNQRPSG